MSAEIREKTHRNCVHNSSKVETTQVSIFESCVKK